jgi:hypothetical protein
MNIEFFCNDEHVSEYWPPVPARDCVPQEILDLHTGKEKYKSDERPILNIKSCAPAMDFISAGYILYNSYAIELTPFIHQFKENIKIKTARTVTDPADDTNMFARKSLAVFHEDACPVINSERKQRVYFKFKTSWGIKTPPGYSCLVIQPQYLGESRFELLSAIVDTDTYHLPIPVAGYLNVKDLIRIEPGTPMLQIIPFKRDDWTMSLTNEYPSDKSKFYIWNAYKRLFHKVKSFL